jgi:hypothetical protein
MKRILIAMMITLIAATAANASDVGVSVSIGQPGFYLNIGNFPPPVVYAHPVVVRPAPVVVARPVYYHVPPGHAKHWYRDHHGYPVYYRHDGRYYR